MIKILIDSASDIDLAEAEQKGIYLTPIQVRFGDEEYLDGINLSHREFFEKLIECSELPKTSQINSFTFEEQFATLTADGSEVIAITLSSKLSGTFAQASEAAKKFAGKVYVVDSLNASVGERILCDYAMALVAQGLKAQDIKAKLEDKKNKIQVLALLDTLKYLKMGGRISSAAAIAGEVFSVKPVITIAQGEVKLAGKAVGSRKGNNLLNMLVEKCGGIDFTMPFTTAYSGLSDEYLQKYMRDSVALWQNYTAKVPAYMIGSTIGTHIGPNAIAVAFFAKD